MLEILKFVFSGFWVFVGTTILFSIPTVLVTDMIVAITRIYFKYLSNKQPK